MSVATPQAPLDDDRSVSVRVRRSYWWVELAVVVWLCWVYDAINNLAPVRQVQAIHHAQQLWGAERFLHLDPELGMDHWLAAHHTLGLLTSDYYDNAHFVVTIGLVVGLWWFRPDLYRPLRTGLVFINLIGFVVFWLYPVAPPRLMANGSFVDVVSLSGAFGSSHSGALAHSANEFAAMPSLHLAWAAWCGWALWRLFRDRSWGWLAWSYPAATTVAVLATGNHFLLDVVAGAITAVVAMVAADRFFAWLAQRSSPEPELQPLLERR